MASDGRGEMASSHTRVQSQNERSHGRTLTLIYMILTLTADVSCSKIIFMAMLIESLKNVPDNIKAERLDGGKTAASSSSPSPHPSAENLLVKSLWNAGILQRFVLKSHDVRSVEGRR